MKFSTRIQSLALALAFALAAPHSGQATPTQGNEFNNTSQTFYTPSATDLINQGTPTFQQQNVSGYTAFSGSSTDSLNDGLTGAASTNPGTAFDPDGAWTSTFVLNTSINTLGYEISSVQTISGWIDVRTNQAFSLSYSRYDNPGTFFSLGSYAYSPISGGDPMGNYSARVTVSDSTGTLASNVGAIRVSIAPGTGGGTVYREIDAAGSASTVLMPPPPMPLKLLPLGDSVTRGSNFNGSIPGGYRKQLETRLAAAGIATDFVGSKSDNPAAGFDPNHEGNDGFRTDQILANLPAWLAEAPDIVTLLIGTNDILQGVAVPTITANLNTLINTITMDDLSRQLYVGSILPITVDYNGRTAAQLEADVLTYNQTVASLATQYAAMGRNVFFVDIHNKISLLGADGLPGTSDDYSQGADGIHPGQAGYNQIGDIWADSVISNVPEPSSFLLLGMGGFALLFLRRRRA